MEKENHSRKKKTIHAIGKTFSTITGFGLLKNAAVNTKSDFNSQKNVILSYLKKIKQNQNTEYHNTFDESAKKHRADDNRLRIRYNQLRLQFWLYTAAVALAPLVIHKSVNAGFHFAILAVIGVGVAFLAKAVQSSYFCWQINHRQFIDARQWVRNPMNWIPGKYGPTS